MYKKVDILRKVVIIMIKESKTSLNVLFIAPGFLYWLPGVFFEVIMGLLENIGGVFDFASNLFKTGYNIYTNERDFNYQRDLQQQVFNREDTAVQRRMADLQAAGLNPNLAAGSAAQAGAVVSRSNTNDLNIGSALDTLNAVNQIKLQKEQMKGQQLQNEMLAMDEDMKAYDSVIKKYKFAREQAQILSDLGIPHMSFMGVDKETGFASPYIYPNTEFNLYETNVNKKATYDIEKQVKELQELGLNIDSLELGNALQQIDVDFATAGKISKFLELLIRAVK